MDVMTGAAVWAVAERERRRTTRERSEARFMFTSIRMSSIDCSPDVTGWLTEAISGVRARNVNVRQRDEALYSFCLLSVRSLFSPDTDPRTAARITRGKAGSRS